MQKRPAVLLVLLATGLTFYEGVLTFRQRQKNQSQQAELARWETQVRQLEGEQRRISAELRSTQARLATLLDEEAAGGNESETLLKSWFQKMDALKAVFAEHPEQSIPEMRLLTPMDWLTLSRDAEFENDNVFRFTLAKVRRYGAQHFVDLMSSALIEFKKAHDEWPASPLELVPYMPTPMDPAMFARYKMMISGKIMPRRDFIEAIAESAPVDKAFDWRLVISTNGQASVTEMRQAPLIEATQSAKLALERAIAEHGPGGLPKDYLSYVESPVVRAVIQARNDWSRANTGATFTDAGALLPYLPTPEARALAEEFWPNQDWKNK